MKNCKLIKSAFCAFMVVCMTFLAGISAFADYSATAPTTDASVKIEAGNNKHYLEEAVIKLVQEGKLTKEKAERILEYKKKRAEELRKLTEEERHQLKKGSLLMDLKKEGIITDKEAQAIRAKLHEMKEARLADGMQGLVEKGVLSPADIDNMRSYMLKVREERKARMEKLQDMTPDERKAYFKEHKGERKDILSRMVEDKVITKEQAEEIRKAVPELNKARYKSTKDKNKQH